MGLTAIKDLRDGHGLSVKVVFLSLRLVKSAKTDKSHCVARVADATGSVDITILGGEKWETAMKELRIGDTVIINYLKYTRGFLATNPREDPSIHFVGRCNIDQISLVPNMSEPDSGDSVTLGQLRSWKVIKQPFEIPPKYTSSTKHKFAYVESTGQRRTRPYPPEHI